MQVGSAVTSEGRPSAMEYREGRVDDRILLSGIEGAPDNFKFNLNLVEDEWIAPRHRHDFDQFRCPLVGEFIYAKDKALPAGWVGYFPAGVRYGPQIRKKGQLVALCQFGGASGRGFISTRQRENVMAEMMTKGSFANGVYTYFDENGGKHNQDAAEAVRERVLGHKVLYPVPRYNDIVVMNPAGFNWIEDPDVPGVAYKWLGTFTERGSSVGFIRVDRGAVFTGGLHNARELLFVMSGAMEGGGQAYPKWTAIGFEPLEGAVQFKAIEPTELWCIRLPRF